MTRTLRRLAAVLALAALAFAQLAVAAYACPKGIDGPSRVQAPAEADAGSGPDISNPNLCERHCDYGSSSVASQAASIPAPDLAPLPWGAAVVAAESATVSTPSPRFARSTAPPSSVRLTPLRI